MEGTIVNDRVLGVLEKYDIEVLRSWKGRGAILCETKTGIKILKEYKKEYSIYISLVGCLIILFMNMDVLENIVGFVKDFKISNFDIPFLEVILKTTGIAILIEYAVSICKDAGENAIANKIDFAGKTIIISLTIPIISQSLELFLEVLPG